jgi:hypothetical protein
MPTGLSSNPDNVTAKDRQMLVGPPVDSNPGSGGSTPSTPTENTDTLGDLTPTKGRIAVGNGSIWTTLDIGADDYVLIADSSQAVGMRWGPVVVPTPTSTFDERDRWLYGDHDPELKDLTDPDLDLWMFGDT